MLHVYVLQKYYPEIMIKVPEIFAHPEACVNFAT